MNVRRSGSIAGACAGLLVGLGGTSAAFGQTPLDTVRVASGLSLPLYAVAPEGDFARLFIVEQRSVSTGRIRILNLPGNTLNATPFLSVSPVSTGDEQGLLGLAFHPEFMTNGYFWVNYTDAGGTTRIVRYRANAPYATSTTADAATATTLLSITQPQANHNGGWMGFGPDGYMYIASGDGGNFNDQGSGHVAGGNAQSTTANLLGKMLRIDVDGDDDIPGNDDDDGQIGMTLPPYTNPATNPFFGVTAGLDEIWSYGLRNHWRNSFDRMTGDLYIADVGQDVIEEVNFQANGAGAGRNYGWRCMEGNNCTGLTGCTCNAASLTLPIHTYTHGGSPFRCSITGGYVYRGCAIPDLQGTYFFGDYCSAQVWTFRYTGSVTQFMERTADFAPGGGLSIASVTSFGEDAFGELYICDRGGEVFKIVPQMLVGTDCNANGRSDACDILANPALDSDLDGVIDSCETSACCVNGACQQITESACIGQQGTWQGLNRSCTEPNICPQPQGGACCCGSSCVNVADAAACTGPNTAFVLAAACQPFSVVTPCCRADFNRTGGPPTSQDIFDFLAAFFSTDANTKRCADFNGDPPSDANVSSQDIFDFLAAFFRPNGCNP